MTRHNEDLSLRQLMDQYVQQTVAALEKQQTKEISRDDLALLYVWSMLEREEEAPSPLISSLLDDIRHLREEQRQLRESLFKDS
ncbi:hypothetical protein [Salibacterium lacus]|uniref:Uncharacterized protein n=1 Tax=Salibacterium lacus TaxID=1898109 RepID=A0ABW5T3B3_9BACI